MARYENEYANFPSSEITLHRFKNVDDTIATVINQINTFRSQGLYNQAARVIENNKDVLGQYVVDANTFRTWEEEIYNTQIYAKRGIQVVYFDDEEPSADIGDVWVGGA